MATNLSGSHPWPGSPPPPDASFNTSLVLADNPGQWTHSIDRWAFQDGVDEGFVDSTPAWFDPADQDIDSEGWSGFGLERGSAPIPGSEIGARGGESISSRSSAEELSFEIIGVANTASAPERHSGSKSPYSTSTESSPWIITTPESTENSIASDAADWTDHFREDGVLEVDDTAGSAPALDITALRRADPTSSPAGPALGPSRVWTLPPRIRRKKKIKTIKSSSDDSRKRTEAGQAAKPAPRRRGAYTDEWKKANTALTRQLKSCIRCRMNRGRCDPDPLDITGACLTCRQMTGPTLCKMPCYRYIVTDAHLYREQQAPYQLFSKRWQSMDIVDIPASHWESDEIRTIAVAPSCVNAPFAFQVRKFRPVEGDRLQDEWPTPHGMNRVSMPNYAVADMRKAAMEMKAYIDQSIVTFINATVGGLDQLLWETYMMAFRHIRDAKTKEEQSLLSNTFRLWTVCRLSSNPSHICSEEKLDCAPVDCPHSPHYKAVPMPLIMTAQFECINYTTFLRPWSKAVLKQLNDLVLAKKREYWFTIYLSMFVLLHSCAMMTRRDEESARQWKLKTRYANPESIKAHHSGAQTMLAHFHFINKGVLPFSLPHTPEGQKELAKAANLTDEQVLFVWRTSNLFREPARAADMKFRRETGQVGHDLYWVSMLFDSDWKPHEND
ncbi:hypothetical protein QBC42DRAFT_166788 [Cladorrhinum samala]|uniref:Zn(2)-C6 fungal-type domain-containing protein n=1 Tax=Cladorrhinum samala TaxID=585594 RepID=A0AAV9I3Z5_9PEZI|nr:hypothetical protein QBC42DRAFT_166788 [Cladorrhinum samala]